MGRMISRRPLVGITAGLLFGALGVLLLGIREERGLAALLFTVSAWFFLFVAAVSVLAGAYAALVRKRRMS